MRKTFNTYLIIWAFALVLFNLVIFVIPSSINGLTIIALVGLVSTDKAFILANIPNFAETIFNKYAGAFWPCYVIIMFTFIGQLVCAFFAFKETNNQKFFYKIPLITISYTGLVFTLIFGIIGMFFPNFPIWLAVVICVIIFVITLVALLKANLAGSNISNTDDKVIHETAFMKEMTAKAKTLWDANKSNEDLRKLYEAFRYANPISNKKTKDMDEKIKKLLIDNKIENISKVVFLLDKRNGVLNEKQ